MYKLIIFNGIDLDVELESWVKKITLILLFIIVKWEPYNFPHFHKDTIHRKISGSQNSIKYDIDAPKARGKYFRGNDVIVLNL